MRPATALSIAGSDSSGGAGIQADIRTMTAFGVFATTAVTSITAQNTLGVTRSLHLPPELVAAEIDAVMEDVGADAAKTGALATAAIIEAVADRIRHHRIRNVVVDPVMIATSGARLMEEDALCAFVRSIVPLALVVTPNIAEAERLSGLAVVSETSMKEAARAIARLGAANVLVKGGHLPGCATDVLFDGRNFECFSAPRVGERSFHGAGCTLSAAIAAGLALGQDLRTAVGEGKIFVTRAISQALDLGRGSAIVNQLGTPRRGGPA
jgi:hydroxymethylpyrimidine/phosphomethylpyrimidine kinase